MKVSTESASRVRELLPDRWRAERGAAVVALDLHSKFSRAVVMDPGGVRS